MSIIDELYYEAHEDDLLQEYEDYLHEFCLDKNIYTFKDFINDIF